MYDILVIGAGPAGMTAALYAKRAGKNVAVLERELPGGQIVNSPLVENYPALPNISGADFAINMQKQLKDLEVPFLYKEVTGIKRDEESFIINEDESLRALSVIMASGVHHRGLNLSGEEELIGAGISFCAVCDGAFYRGRDAIVVGGGDTALQDAVYLSSLCRKVYLVHRREAFRAAQALVEKVRSKDNIELLTPYVPLQYLTEDGVISGLTVENKTDGSRRSLAAEGIFLAVGQSPENGFAIGLAELTPAGYIMAGEDCRTNVAGLFAAGDCREKLVRQLTTAVGDGATAATLACEYVDAL